MTDLYHGFILPVWNWKTPALMIPQQSSGDFRIIKRTVTAGTAWPMCKTLGYDYCIFMSNATLTLLQEKVRGRWKDWMVDSPYEWYAMGEFSMRTVPPNVLIGGLGLGLILHHLTQRRDLEKIVVVEMSKNVIEMVSPYLPNDDRIKVIHGDLFKLVPKFASEDAKFNTIIVDIWAGENYECIEKLENTIDLLYNYYPDSLHMFHSFQKMVEMEIIAKYLEGIEKPIRFIPSRFTRHRK
jgi:hypothetical protein